MFLFPLKRLAFGSLCYLINVTGSAINGLLKIGRKVYDYYVLQLLQCL